MQAMRRLARFILMLTFIYEAVPAQAQYLLDTVDVGTGPSTVVANPITNKIYVGNYLSQSITVIDGATDGTQFIAPGIAPSAMALNTATNKIYATSGVNKLTIIDGATNALQSVTVGNSPQAVAVNFVSNRIYVVNSAENTVSIVDGATLSTAKVTVGGDPQAVAVNPVTNKIYVTNWTSNSVSVIDGNTNIVTPLPVGISPQYLAVNPLTDKIYVSNHASDNVAIIDDASGGITYVPVPDAGPVAINTVSNQIYVSSGVNVIAIDGLTGIPVLIPVGLGSAGIAVNNVTNQIYVTDGSGSVAVIDGSTNQVKTVEVGRSPQAIAVNTATNRIYAANYGGFTVSVIAGASAAPLQFMTLASCRLVDTRPDQGGGGPILAGTSQSFPLSQLGKCSVPASAAAYSLNVTAVPTGRLGYLTIWPTGEDQPGVSLLNSLDGRIKANAAIVPAGYMGAVNVFAKDTANILIDIDGYFTAPTASTLRFYPITPCRVVDTRGNPGSLGGPVLSGNHERDFPILQSACIPNGIVPAAYSFNVTAVPHQSGQRLGFLTVWPQGDTRPEVSTLNNLTGTIVANAAIVAAGVDGGVAVYPNNDTDLLIDIAGYFANLQGGMQMYPAAPCRVVDTRQTGNGQPFQGTLPVNVLASACMPPSDAEAYVMNATVAPQTTLGFLALWADGGPQPGTSTLNAKDGALTSNMAIVPTSNGSIDAYANSLTQLILDISGYFAP